MGSDPCSAGHRAVPANSEGSVPFGVRVDKTRGRGPAGLHDLDPRRVCRQAFTEFVAWSYHEAARVRIDNADELLESFLDTFHDEPLTVRAQKI